MMSTLQPPCPCGSGEVYDACCGRLHRGEAEAQTALELMRARYSAYAMNLVDYVFRTWHPRSRPDDLEPDPVTNWTGLRIVDVLAGAPGDETGEVEFVATHSSGSMHERSRFVRRGTRWVYVDGDTIG